MTHHPVTTRKDEGMIDLIGIKNWLEENKESTTHVRLNDLKKIIQALSEAKEIMEDYKKEKDFFSSHRLNNDIDLWLTRYFSDTRKEASK